MENELLALAERAAQELKKHGFLIATAESCTGGGLSYYLTSVAGASHWFDRGFVTYSNQAKTALLNVDPHLIKTFGAVSEETAREMALGAIDMSDATVGIAITGIAGPTGGTDEKPVGTVYIAIAKRDEDIRLNDYIFEGDRQTIRDMTIKTALQNLLEWLATK